MQKSVVLDQVERSFVAQWHSDKLTFFFKFDNQYSNISCTVFYYVEVNNQQVCNSDAMKVTVIT